MTEIERLVAENFKQLEAQIIPLLTDLGNRLTALEVGDLGSPSGASSDDLPNYNNVWNRIFSFRLKIAREIDATATKRNVGKMLLDQTKTDHEERLLRLVGKLKKRDCLSCAFGAPQLFWDSAIPEAGVMQVYCTAKHMDIPMDQMPTICGLRQQSLPASQPPCRSTTDSDGTEPCLAPTSG